MTKRIYSREKINHLATGLIAEVELQIKYLIDLREGLRATDPMAASLLKTIIDNLNSRLDAMKA